MQDKTLNREYHFIINEPHCLGHNEEKEWSIKEWKEDQGINEYNEMNDYWIGIITNAAILTQEELSSEKLQMFYMVSYDLDRFKRFLFETRFLDLFDIEKGVIERIKRDEVELMKFGFRWLKFSLFGENTLKIKDAALEAKKREPGIK